MALMVSHCDKNLTSMQLSASQKADPMLLRSKSIVLSFFCLGNVAWSHSIFFNFVLDQKNETSFCLLSWCCEASCCIGPHTIPAIMMKHFLLKFVLLCLQWETQQAQTLRLFPDCTVPYFNPSCHFPDLCIILFWWTHRLYPLFLLVEAVYGQPLCGWSLMSVSVVKVVYHCLTLLVPMQSSPCACWSCVWISDGGIFPSTHNFITAHCVSLPVILMHRNMTIWQWGRQLDFYSGMWHWMEVVIIYCALHYCIFVYNSMMLITFCTTFIRITPRERVWYVRSVQNFSICCD